MPKVITPNATLKSTKPGSPSEVIAPLGFGMPVVGGANPVLVGSHSLVEAMVLIAVVPFVWTAAVVCTAIARPRRKLRKRRKLSLRAAIVK